MKEKDKIYKLEEVFTPSQPAFYTYVERQAINKRLNRAMRIPGKQIILYGFSGAGKTTLFTNKIKLDDIKCIITRCTGIMSMTDIIIDAFNQLDIYYISSSEDTQSGKVGGDIGISYLGVKALISKDKQGGSKQFSKRIVDLPITPQTLAKYIGEAGCCWVIEDFHKIDIKEKTQMAQIMKVFMDYSLDYPSLRVIAVGAVNSAREVVQYDPEMKNRISEIEVPLMSNDFLRNILNKGEKLLKIEIPRSIVDKIIAYSCGLPAVTHQLAYLLCEVNNIIKTNDSNKYVPIPINSFDQVLEEYLKDNSDSFKSIYEYAIRIIHKRKSENPSEILKAILYNNKDSVTINEIKETLQLWDRTYKGINLKKYVEEFTTPFRSEILRYNKESMKFYFSNPFIKAYCHSILKTDIKEYTNKRYKLEEFRITLDRELKIAYDTFIEDRYNSDDLSLDFD